MGDVRGHEPTPSGGLQRGITQSMKRVSVWFRFELVRYYLRCGWKAQVFRKSLEGIVIFTMTVSVHENQCKGLISSDQ